MSAHALAVASATGSPVRFKHWHVPSGAARDVDDLNFTARGPDGLIRWWDVTPPKTDYWHVHQMLGRAYGFELLDLIHNPARGSDLHPHTLAFIASAIVRSRTGNDGLRFGFFSAISEYLITGRANR